MNVTKHKPFGSANFSKFDCLFRRQIDHDESAGTGRLRILNRLDFAVCQCWVVVACRITNISVNQESISREVLTHQ